MTTWRTIAVLVGVLAVPASARGFDPAYEARNFGKGSERAAEYNAPGFRAQMAEVGLAEEAEAAQILATDRERDFTGSLCWQHLDGCQGDPRFYAWQPDGHGLRVPVLFTARSGATLSGHLWMTRAGPPVRPAVVITPGSVQAPEELYSFAAATLAKRGYLVLTYDVQGQGRSDTYGEGADRNESVPSQAGQPFWDNTEDALDFLFSSPGAPFRPRPSCSSGTSHAPKQDRRVKAGLNPAFNPLWAFLDPNRVGLAGHSFGAQGVSFVGQADPRVKAVVAWDRLGKPATVSSCASAPATREAEAVPITKPALGMSGDYGIFAPPNATDPDPAARGAVSRAYSAAGVDSGELVIRGGTHFEFAYIANPGFPATLRGMDLVAWYTGAWFDKYVKGDAGADARLLTDRWRDDAPGRAVDSERDGNLLSRYSRSRLDIALARGGRFACEDLRTGCAGQSAADGEPRPYSYAAAGLTKDSGPLPAAVSPVTPGAGTVGIAPACEDRLRPRARVSPRKVGLARRRVVMAGTATDRGCVAGGRVARVEVAVSQRRGTRCRPLRPDGRLGGARSCLRPVWLPARGTTTWRSSRPAVLPTGSYRFRARATDAAGNVQRRPRLVVARNLR